MATGFRAEDIEALLRNAERASALLRVIGNKWRLLIACHLATGEKNVTELVHYTGLRQSVLSQHLMVLRRWELVSTRRVAQNIYYSLSSAAVTDLILTLHKHYCEVNEEAEFHPGPQPSSAAVPEHDILDRPQGAGRTRKAKVPALKTAKAHEHKPAPESR